MGEGQFWDIRDLGIVEPRREELLRQVIRGQLACRDLLRQLAEVPSVSLFCGAAAELLEG